MKNTVAAKTAYSGQLSETVINEFLNIYIDCCQNKQLPPENAIEIAANLEFFSSYDPAKKEVLGEDEYLTIVQDSFGAATKVIEYVTSEYESLLLESHHTGILGPDFIISKTGKPSNADILLRTEQDYLGASLKYSRSPRRSTIKLFSPTIASFVSFFENTLKHSQLRTLVDAISQEGLQNQINSLIPFHDYLQSLTCPAEYHGNSCTYLDGKLSRGAISWIRDTKTEENKMVYRAISTENKNINKRLASTIANTLYSFKDSEHLSTIFRYITNTNESNSLDTFCVYTKRKKPVVIHDIHKIVNEYLERGQFNLTVPTDRTTFSFGPGSIYVDCRPTCHRPVYQYTINYYMKV